MSFQNWITPTCSESVRRFCVRVSIQKTIEPIALPIEAFHQVLGLTVARQIVVLAWKNDQLRVYSVVPQRAEPLFALLQRNAIVIVRMQDQSRSLHVLGVFQRRCVP